VFLFLLPSQEEEEGDRACSKTARMTELLVVVVSRRASVRGSRLVV
jgi:hypothetical protein